MRTFYDIAIRDTVMAVDTFILAQLTEIMTIPNKQNCQTR